MLYTHFFIKKDFSFYKFTLLTNLLLFFIHSIAQENHPIRKRLKDQYDYIDYFKNNVAPARTFKDTYTLLDTLGNQLFPAKFAYIHNTGYDLLEAGVVVKNKMRRGYINKTGAIIIPLQYDAVYMPKSDLAIVEQNGKVGLLNKRNQIILPIESNYITDAYNNRLIVQRNNLYAFYNSTGKPVTQFIFKDVERFYHNVASVLYPNNSSCLIDTNGKQLFTPIAQTAIQNTNERFATLLNTTTQKYGVIDRSGKITIPIVYTEIELLNDISIVTKNKKKGIVSNEGQILSPLIYDAIYEERSISNRFYAKKGTVYGIIDKNNKEIIPVQYDLVTRFLQQYFIVKNTNGTYGIKDENGTTIIPEEYDFYAESGDLIFCSKNNQCLILNVLDTNNNIILPNDIQFKKNRSGFFSVYNSKFQIFMQNNRYGLMNDSAHIVIPAIYDDINSISHHGLYSIQLNGKYGLMNQHGKLLKPIQYDAIVWRKEYLALQIKGKKEEVVSIYRNED